MSGCHSVSDPIDIQISQLEPHSSQFFTESPPDHIYKFSVTIEVHKTDSMHDRLSCREISLRMPVVRSRSL